MTTTTEAKPLTAADLLRLYSDGVRGELIRGVLCETMPAGIEHGKIVMDLAFQLNGFIKPGKLGTLVGSDSGVWLERAPDTVREPDLAFFAAEKMPPGVRVTGYAEVVPDLVVEVHSPRDSHREVHDKARMWLSHGVRLVWVVHPETRTVDVHHRDQPVGTLAGEGPLDGLDVLPGFSCPLGAVFGN